MLCEPCPALLLSFSHSYGEWKVESGDWELGIGNFVGDTAPALATPKQRRRLVDQPTIRPSERKIERVSYCHGSFRLFPLIPSIRAGLNVAASVKLVLGSCSQQTGTELEVEVEMEGKSTRCGLDNAPSMRLQW